MATLYFVTVPSLTSLSKVGLTELSAFSSAVLPAVLPMPLISFTAAGVNQTASTSATIPEPLLRVMVKEMSYDSLPVCV